MERPCKKLVAAFVLFSVIFSVLPSFGPRARAQTQDPCDVDIASPECAARIGKTVNTINENQKEVEKIAQEIGRDPAVACEAESLEGLGIDLISTGFSALAQNGINWLAKQGGNWGKVGGFLGGGDVPTRDAGAIAGQLFDRVRRCALALKENAFKVAFNDFKKRLLDSLVDDTLQWIKNGFKDGPGFYQDFGQALKNAGNAAVGDVAKDLGLAQFCSPFQKQFAESLTTISDPLTVPTFSEQVSCTLTDIVGNVKDFGQDFKQGGWKGYLELAKPQNNSLGQMMLVLNEINQRKAEEERKKELELIAYQGYKPTTECVLWDVFNQRGDRVARSVGKAEKDRYDGSLYTFTCVKEDITTPGSSVGAIADAALTADFRYAINAGDLTPYFGAILDTAFRRLIGGKDKGLAGIEKSRSSQGLKPQTFSERAAEIAADQNLSDEEKIAQFDSITGLIGTSSASFPITNKNTQFSLSSKKGAEELRAKLADSTSPDSLLSLINQAEKLQKQILLAIRGKSADPDLQQSERAFFETFLGPDLVNEGMKGLVACQSDLAVAATCTIAQIQNTNDTATAIEQVGTTFPEDRQQLNALIAEIDGIIPLFEDAPENTIISINTKLLSIQNKEREVRSKYRTIILALVETLDGGQNVVGTKTELQSCVSYLVTKNENEVYHCPAVPQ